MAPQYTTIIQCLSFHVFTKIHLLPVMIGNLHATPCERVLYEYEYEILWSQSLPFYFAKPAEKSILHLKIIKLN